MVRFKRLKRRDQGLKKVDITDCIGQVFWMKAEMLERKKRKLERKTMFKRVIEWFRAHVNS